VRAVSAAFLRTVLASHQAIFRATVCTTFQTGTTPTGTRIPIEDGTVSLDGTADVRSTLDLTTDGTKMWPTTAASLLAPYTADPDFLRTEALREAKQATWHIDKQKGIASSAPADFKGPRIELPLRPMLGCIGTAPDNHAAIHTSTPDNFGGNMDYNGMGAGATLMLPVFERGALLFLGDGHARQGDGEVVGSAIETSLDVEFSVDLIKVKKIGWPRLETQDYIMVLGSSRALNEALQHATTELLRWLMDSYGFDERGASLLLGQGMEYDISNVVDPEFTIVAKMRKRYLGAPR